jgi:hypothetical protein
MGTAELGDRVVAEVREHSTVKAGRAGRVTGELLVVELTNALRRA